jgi:hypothetical protein
MEGAELGTDATGDQACDENVVVVECQIRDAGN